jgi:hypothetical protein
MGGKGMLRVAPNGMAALELIHPDLPKLVAKAGVLHQTSRFAKCAEDGAVISDTETPVVPTEQTQDNNSNDNNDNKQTQNDDAHPSVLISWHALQQVFFDLA